MRKGASNDTNANIFTSGFIKRNRNCLSTLGKCYRLHRWRDSNARDSVDGDGSHTDGNHRWQNRPNGKTAYLFVGTFTAWTFDTDGCLGANEDNGAGNNGIDRKERVDVSRIRCKG